MQISNIGVLITCTCIFITNGKNFYGLPMAEGSVLSRSLQWERGTFFNASSIIDVSCHLSQYLLKQLLSGSPKHLHVQTLQIQEVHVGPHSNVCHSYEKTTVPTLYLCMYVFMYIYMYVCMCVCM